jgi:DNA-binding transcriptional regulator YdaS (Cro superfamily)
MSTHAIRRACAALGSQAELARRVGVSVSMVSQWCTGARPLPTERCIDIERETRASGDPVTVEELRPDVDWAVIRGRPCPCTAAQGATAP